MYTVFKLLISMIVRVISSLIFILFFAYLPKSDFCVGMNVGFASYMSCLFFVVAGCLLVFTRAKPRIFFYALFLSLGTFFAHFVFQEDWSIWGYVVYALCLFIVFYYIAITEATLQKKQRKKRSNSRYEVS